MARLQKLPPVVLATPLVDGQAMLSSGPAVRGVVLRGMPIDALKRLPALAGNVRAGTLDNLSQSRQVAIGLRLAERYGIGVGDPVTLIAPRGTVTPFGTTPRIKQFRVAAIFSIGLSEYDLNIMFSGLETAQGFFSESAQSGAIELILDDPDKVEAYREDLQNTAGLDVSLVDWKQSNRTLAGALEVERNVMFLILTLILLVAALNIVSGLVMLVRDKHRDIAVLRSRGARRGMVLRVFFITGASGGVIGSLAGCGLGVVFCAYIEEIRQLLVMITGAQLFPAEVYFLERMPARLVMSDVLQVLSMALTLSFLSTLYPAGVPPRSIRWRPCAMNERFSLRGIHQCFDRPVGGEVLKGVDLTIAAGETVALLGRRVPANHVCCILRGFWKSRVQETFWLMAARCQPMMTACARARGYSILDLSTSFIICYRSSARLKMSCCHCACAGRPVTRRVQRPGIFWQNSA